MKNQYVYAITLACAGFRFLTATPSLAQNAHQLGLKAALAEADQKAFANQGAWAQAELAQRVADVQLYKALGGGWSEPPADQPAG